MSERVSKVAYLGEDLGATWGQLGFNLGGQIGDNFAYLALVFSASAERRSPKKSVSVFRIWLPIPNWPNRNGYFCAIFLVPI